MHYDGTANLIPCSERTKEEVKEIGRKGGKASGEARRRKKTFREVLSDALSRQITDEQAKQKLEALGYDGTWLDLINQAQLDKASKGDTEAYRAVRDTVGERPRDGLEIGNLDDKPLATLDLSSMSDEQLKTLLAARQDKNDSEE